MYKLVELARQLKLYQKLKEVSISKMSSLLRPVHEIHVGSNIYVYSSSCDAWLLEFRYTLGVLPKALQNLERTALVLFLA